MRRREFLSLIGGAAAMPIVAHAQQAMPRVGVLMTPAEGDQESQMRLAAFREGLQKLGWIEGQNLQVDYRWGGGDSKRIEAHAADLVRLAPKVIVANGTPAVAALQHATSSVPIVFALVMDPVGLGYIKSFSRPGGNITGFTFVDLSLFGKWVEMIKAIAPATVRAAVVHNPAVTPYYAPYLHSPEAAQISQAVRLIDLPARDLSELEGAIVRFGEQPGGSLIFPPDPFNVVHFERCASLARQLRIPTVSVYRNFARAGGLMAYGPDTADIFRRSASYIDRILNGANPAQLPAQNPDKFELVINNRAAKTLDLAVPPTLLATADEVIE